MPDSPDMNDLARRYMDLWQEHLNALAGDQDTAEALAKTMALMSSGAQAFAAAAPSAAQDSPHDDGGAGADGAAAAAASDGGAGPDVSELLERLAALEERVAQLESDARKRRK